MGDLGDRKNRLACIEKHPLLNAHRNKSAFHSNIDWLGSCKNRRPTKAIEPILGAQAWRVFHRIAWSWASRALPCIESLFSSWTRKPRAATSAVNLCSSAVQFRYEFRGSREYFTASLHKMLDAHITEPDLDGPKSIFGSTAHKFGASSEISMTIYILPMKILKQMRKLFPVRVRPLVV